MPESEVSDPIGQLYYLRCDITFIDLVLMKDIQTALADTEDAPPDVVDALRDELRRAESVRAKLVYELRQIEAELSKLPPAGVIRNFGGVA